MGASAHHDEHHAPPAGNGPRVLSVSSKNSKCRTVEIVRPPLGVERSFLPAIVRGLALTAKHFFKNTFRGIVKDHEVQTIEYPDVKPDYPARYRGLHRLMHREDGSVESGLVLLRIVDLAELNRSIGHATTDRLIETVAQALQAYTARVAGCFIGRLNGADFAMCLGRTSGERLPWRSNHQRSSGALPKRPATSDSWPSAAPAATMASTLSTLPAPLLTVTL